MNNHKIWWTINNAALSITEAYALAESEHIPILDELKILGDGISQIMDKVYVLEKDPTKTN